MVYAVKDYLERISAYGLVNVLIELIIIGIVIYITLRFLEGTRGLRLFRGLVLLVASFMLIVGVLAENLNLLRLKVLAQPVVYIVFFGSLVVFQPELRRALLKLGEARWFRGRSRSGEKTIRAIASAAKYLSDKKIGALIAIERQVGLGHIIETGIRVDGIVSSELLRTIFWPGSALHDLGVVIQEDRVAAAGCQFPLTDSDQVDPSLGSRHRAAVGLSEDSDAIVVVVSEETGIISLAFDGKLYRGFGYQELESRLRELLLDEAKG